ncbi:MAG: 3D domain-containing protein [Candidatus Colwellbacteria bacterium]|nr:3D domain-containing protein [Candidatus Colwellbacteria bacterium]
MKKYTIFALILALFIALKIGILVGEAQDKTQIEPESTLYDAALTGVASPGLSGAKYAVITAYSSTPGQTDDTPFITASGERVRDGIVAANWLPFGAEIRIPELFGNKVFIVKDRMHRRFSDRVDIWFANTKEAKKFGKQTALIEVL